MRAWFPDHAERLLTSLNGVRSAGAPVVGALTGLLAGLYPAWRATRIEPADALRR